MDQDELITRIKASFSGLTNFKRRGDILEVITPHTTLNNKFVSVFIKTEKTRFVVTDGGWISSNYYDTPIYEESEDIINRTISSYLSTYSIKETKDAQDQIFYYKTCESLIQLTSCVFDVSSFVLGAVNAKCVQYSDEKEQRAKETFRIGVNGFLKANYGETATLHKSLDDVKNIKFNAVIVKHNLLYLITYVTGSTSYYFENDLRRSIVNFEISQKSVMRDVIKERISIINNESSGYDPIKASEIINLLSEKTSRPPINWSEKERILEYI